MTYKIGVDVCTRVTVTVEAETEDEAFKLACKKAVENPEDTDHETPVADSCEIISTVEDFSPMYDRVYEERREEMAA